ncbi:MAG: IS1595 family transposase [Propionibacteriaceae bacterium]|jgi:transposase-like protein|nr:IS1595 family transposase [Propionibacteriaceae bacterium]
MVLREVVYEDAYSSVAADDVEACLRCGSVTVTKKGRTADGSQRWLCHDCHRTFSGSTSRVIGMSKLPASVWMQYVECFVDALPLRVCATRCHVGLRTAWLMRHRLLECIQRYLPDFHAGAGDGVQVDETYFRENFKGNYTHSKNDLPRPARSRGASLKKRGLSKEQMCVMTGIDDQGAVFLDLCGRGAPTKDQALSALAGRVGRGAEVMTDKATAYRDVLSTLGATHTAVLADSHGINRVNTLHSLLGRFMHRFHGVATKHLTAYLIWFQWRRTFQTADTDAAKVTTRQIANGVCQRSTTSWVGVESPYMEYWLAA